MLAETACRIVMFGTTLTDGTFRDVQSELGLSCRSYVERNGE